MALAGGCEGKPTQQRLDSGQRLYTSYCAPCHHDTGSGVERSGPPLVGSAWVRGPDSRLARIVLHGLRGAIEVAGKTYSLEMPGFGRILEDQQLADVLTYVRHRFGAGAAPVTHHALRRAREATRDRGGYFTAQELREARDGS